MLGPPLFATKRKSVCVGKINGTMGKFLLVELEHFPPFRTRRSVLTFPSPERAEMQFEYAGVSFRDWWEKDFAGVDSEAKKKS